MQDTKKKKKVQKSVAFFYTDNEVAEREIKTKIPFTRAPKIIKYLGINVNKVKDLTENHTILMKKVTDNTNGKILHSHGLEE